MILKIPKWMKRITYKPLIFFDQFFEKLNFKYASAIHISVWKKIKFSMLNSLILVNLG